MSLTADHRSYQSEECREKRIFKIPFKKDFLKSKPAALGCAPKTYGIIAEELTFMSLQFQMGGERDWCKKLFKEICLKLLKVNELHKFIGLRSPANPSRIKSKNTISRTE